METNARNQSSYNELDIAVIGMDCRFPDADSPEDYWENLKNGLESVVTLSDEDLQQAGIPPEIYNQPHYVKAASCISGPDQFAASFFGYSGKEAAVMDPQHRIFLELCWNALEKAGYDSERYPGDIGVFAGATFNSYMLNNVFGGRGISNSGDQFFIQIANDKDNLATRVAYKLNLRGPALSLQTACSTSLVSIHYACQSLLNQECDMALAGGVTVRSPHKAGYLYQPEMILSQDGHCRPFDGGASGTVFGNGAGVVVLKRLEDAVRDGDRIRAIIKGSAVNNDGSEKVGYTAPGRRGQEAVLTSALTLSGVPKESITAVEAHGTGTILGDPIEFESLNKVYGGSGGQHRVALGSVKSNLGHLECAAGIASFIKMVLCLEHKTLVPSLNYECPNPHIRLDNTPFYVNIQTREWLPAEGEPLRCGVSAFGIGGTNAHLILEEGIQRAAAKQERPVELVLLSARTESALESMSTRLAGHLRQNPETPLADLAYTLRSGRRELEFRRAAIASDGQELAHVLEENNPRQSWSFPRKHKDPQVVFMFPGQGSQHIRMAREVYLHEPVFRERLDAGAELLQPLLKLDIRDILFPQETQEEEAARALTKTCITQPVLFVIEYALACLWQSWGVKPHTMIGHSIGEYAAACLAGVMSFEDGVRVVVKRGQLIHELPQGKMCGVSMSEEEVQSFLTGSLSIAALNGPTFSVVSGPAEDMEVFTEALERRGLPYSILHTSHAFHSPMMEPICEPFAAYMRTIALRPPQIPYLSNVTGEYITAEEAVSPEYWARHILAPVRFSQGISALLNKERLIFLETGPGMTLATFIKNHDPKAAVVSCLPRSTEHVCSLGNLYGAAGKLWMMGLSIDWSRFEGDREYRKTELPGYPFERKSYWLEPAGGRLEQEFDARVQMDGDGNREEAGGSASGEGSAGKEVPSNDVERAVLHIFRKTLGSNEVGIKDNFFELGGHSLLAIQLLSQVNEKFQTQIKLNDFFKFPTVAELAREVGNPGGGNAANQHGHEHLPALVEDQASRYEPFPLTEMQEAQWLGRIGSFQLGNVAAHVYFETEKAGIELDRLQSSWQTLVDRHEMLRTIVLPEGAQTILKERLIYNIRNLDVSRLDPAAAEAEALKVRQEMDHILRPIDQWPLFEIRTTQLPGGKVRIHFSIDLLICDVGSMRILQSEWALLYKDPQLQLPELGLSFRDYVFAEKKLKQTEAYAKADAYWERRVSELPATTAPELPIAKSLSAIRELRFKRWSFVVGKDKWEKIKDAAVKLSLSPSSVILAAFSQVLGQWSKSKEFCINTPIINRLPLHPQVKQLVGEFASFAPVAVDLNRATGFGQLAKELQNNSWENLENRYISGTAILRKLAKQRGGSSGTVLPVVFTSTIVQKVEHEEEFDNQFGGYSYLISQTPQVWLDHTAMENERGLLLSWHALEEMFPAGMLDSMWTAYEQFMNRLADDEKVWNSRYWSLVPSRDLELKAEANATAQTFTYELLQGPFLRQTALHPEKPALITASKTVTYGQLSRWANGLGRRLRTLGLERAELVGIIMEKGYEQAAAVLGTLLGGGAYLPLDPELPRERLQSIMAGSRVRFVFTQAQYRDALDWLEHDGKTVMAVSEETLAEACTDEVLEQIQDLDDLAYVIFTSGSTGNPKGVMISHRAAQNTILDINGKFGVTESDRCFALSELNFDLSVYDLFGLLGAGGTMVIPNANSSRDPEHWLELVNRHQVTVWNTVPALMEMLTVYAATKAASLPMKLIMMSGDWIPVNLPGRIRQLCPGAQIIGLGGATEASIWSNFYPIEEVHPDWSSIPYGKPLANQQFHVLTADLTPCPIWVPGELYIGGMGVSMGYLNEPALTARSFIIHPVTGERLYKTGDWGRYLPDGNLEFLGRDDFQVKISGFRVELEDIEAALGKHPAVRAVIVNAVGESKDKKRLVGYVVVKDDQQASPEELTGFARTLLPDYMVPGEYVMLDRFPLTPNGKIDRKALPEPQSGRTGSLEMSMTSDHALVKRLVAIFAEVLKQEEDRIDIHANFFALGGDSIMGIQIISRAEKEGIDISPQLFFEHTTIAKLAQALQVNLGSGSEDAEQFTGPVPLGQGQRWMLDTYGASASSMNWSALLRVTEPFHPQKLESAFQYVALWNDGLQVQFRQEGTSWEQTYAEHKGKPEIDYVDISGMQQDDVHELMDNIAADLVQEQDIQSGQMLKLCLFEDQRAGLQYLLLIWNPLIMDMRSFPVFMQQLEETYRQLLADGAVRRPAGLRSFKDWASTEQETPSAGSKAPCDKKMQHPIDLGSGRPGAGGMETLVLHLSKQAEWDQTCEMAKLSGEELFLTALAVAAAQQDCADTLAADWVSASASGMPGGFERLVGQASTVKPIVLGLDWSSETDAMLRSAKEQIRQCASAALCTEVAFRSQVRFAYHGTAAAAGNCRELKLVKHDRGAGVPGTQPYELELDVIDTADRITLAVRYDAAAVAGEKAEKLAQAVIHTAEDIVFFMHMTDKNMFVATDFPSLDWDDQELNLLLGMFAGIR